MLKEIIVVVYTDDECVPKRVFYTTDTEDGRKEAEEWSVDFEKRGYSVDIYKAERI